MANQILASDNLTMNSADLDVVARGTFTVPTETLDAPADLVLSESLSKRAGTDFYRHAREGNRVVLPAIVGGTLSKPAVRIDAAAAIRRAIGNEVERQLKGLLDRLSYRPSRDVQQGTPTHQTFPLESDRERWILRHSSENRLRGGGHSHGVDIMETRSKRLSRIPAEGRIAGVCAGLATYCDVDVTFVRLACILLSIFPGGLIGGVIAYVAAWLVMPVDSTVALPDLSQRRLRRSSTDMKIAGVCAGIAEYLDVDPTVVRLVWVMLTIVPGAIVLGVIAYAAAWLIMPPGAVPQTQSAPSTA